MPILVRQIKYLNKIVEQDHRAMKRVTWPVLKFKSFRSAGPVLAGIELMHMIRKGQFAVDDAAPMLFADQFYVLAGQVRPVSAGVMLSVKNSVLGSTTRQNQRKTPPIGAFVQVPCGGHPLDHRAT